MYNTTANRSTSLRFLFIVHKNILVFEFETMIIICSVVEKLIDISVKIW